MKNLKSIVITAFVIMLSINISIAQNDKQIGKKKSEVDQKIEMMEKRMENASPEEKAYMREKIEAYKNEVGNNANAFGQARAAASKDKIKQAYMDIEASYQVIDEKSEVIKAAEARLNDKIANNQISKEEAVKEQALIEKAKTELTEAHLAIKRQKRALDANRTKTIKVKQ